LTIIAKNNKYRKNVHENKKYLFTFALISCFPHNSSDTALCNYRSVPNVTNTFSGKIDLNKLQNYANQTVPAYITKDNTVGNVITDKGATLGRVFMITACHQLMPLALLAISKLRLECGNC
jgi:hypothetical protein